MDQKAKSGISDTAWVLNYSNELGWALSPKINVYERVPILSPGAKIIQEPFKYSEIRWVYLCRRSAEKT